MTVLAYLPSPDRGTWYVGPLPLRAYALCIVAGVVIAVVVGQRRWSARGGRAGEVADIAAIAVPAGIVGGRIYHVITTPGPYFGEGGDPVRALYVWEGGLGIWGGIALGTLVAYLLCRRRGIRPSSFADALAPGVVLAQAVGRLGNWFNQELYGRPTTLPWALEIDPENRPAATPAAATYHPTFLYELLWNVGVAVLCLWAERRWRLGAGRVFALYVAGYCVGRAWIEALRVDEALMVGPLRLNDLTAAAVLCGAVAFLVARRGQGPGPAYEPGRGPEDTGEDAGGDGPDDQAGHATVLDPDGTAGAGPVAGSPDDGSAAPARPPGADRSP